MKFDPISKKVYTDQGKFLKKLHCPYQMTWDQLKEIDTKDRFCGICKSRVVDSNDYSDQELFDIIQKNEETCLKIDLNQKNLRVITYGSIERK